MTANILVLGFLIVLVLLLAAAWFVKQRQAQQHQPHEQPMSRAAAPAINPLLHDETLVSAAEGGSAGDERPGTTSHVSVIAGAPRQTHVLQPGQSLIIGRQSRHGISLRNDRVSREHARLVFVKGGVQLTDLGSTNGTFIHEERQRLAPHTPELLTPGAVFWIGPEVKLSVDAPPSQPQT